MEQKIWKFLNNKKWLKANMFYAEAFERISTMVVCGIQFSKFYGNANMIQFIVIIVSKTERCSKFVFQINKGFVLIPISFYCKKGGY